MSKKDELKEVMEQIEQKPQPTINSSPQAPMKDEPIVPGGPLRSEVESWKKQFGNVYAVQLSVSNDEDDPAIYIWRPLNRAEYKAILALKNTDPLQREEMICETCVLWPKGFTYEVIASGKAGIPSTLAELIMSTSGFIQDAQVVVL